MATNYHSEGKVWTVTAPTGGLTANDVYVIVSGTSGFAGVVLTDADAGETCAVQVDECFTLAKLTTTGKDFSQGEIVYWDDSANKCTNLASGNTRIGRAKIAAAVADTTVVVELNV